MDFAPVLGAPVEVKTHLVAALLALAIGAIILSNVKGTRLHKTLGWGYVALMLIVAVTAFFIRRDGASAFSLDGMTPIHLLIVLTVVSLPLALYSIRRGDVRGHARSMIGLFVGGLLVAGALTLLPGRIMHQAIFGG